MRRRILPAFAFLSLAAAAHADWDLAGDFSSTQNPNGVWTCGLTDASGAGFSAYTLNFDAGGLSRWADATTYPADYPTVVKNVSGADAAFGPDRPLAPGETAFHPGPSNERSVVRWMAPESIRGRLSAGFFGLDNSTTVDLHVLVGGVERYAKNLDGLGTQAFGYDFDLAKGETIDVEVGSRGGFNSDTTGLSVHIAPVPEPASSAALGLGLLALRRRARA